MAAVSERGASRHAAARHDVRVRSAGIRPHPREVGSCVGSARRPRRQRRRARDGHARECRASSGLRGPIDDWVANLNAHLARHRAPARACTRRGETSSSFARPVLDDQVPRLEAAARPRARGDRRGLGALVLPSTCSPARHGSRRRSSSGARTSPRSTRLATPRSSAVATSRPISTAVDMPTLEAELARLDQLPGRDGYFTETFCQRSRFFTPENGARIDAIRDAIATDHTGTPLEPLLLTSLIEAADRVDSTTGVQMAYLKQWAPRAHQPLTLRTPALLRGAGRAIRGDARRAGEGDRVVRPRVPRPSVQPAPLLHELPRVGDPGRVGCARALRRGMQADRRPRRRRLAAPSTLAARCPTRWPR